MRALRHPIHISFALLVAAAAFGFMLGRPHVVASQSSSTVIFLTSGTSWTVPSDWNNSNNSIEVIGGGGGGGGALGQNGVGSGGGGGGYSKISNVTLTPGTNVGYKVGAAGTVANGNGGRGGDTYFCNSTSNCASITGTAVIVGSKGGSGGTVGGSGAAGGAASGGIGTVKYSGGAGRNSQYGAYGGGGGGAAGPHGNGGVGTGTLCNPGAGDAGFGGGVAPCNNSGGQTLDNPTPPGYDGFEWDSSHGSGGGGGGAANADVQGGAGGLYGAGGAGSRTFFSIDMMGGLGAPGLIVITYTPFTVTVPGAPTSLVASGDVGGNFLSWSAPASNGGNSITGYKVYRGTSSPASTLIATLGNSTTYVDTNVTGGTTYYYRVTAINALGESAYSNEANTTPSAPQSGTAITGYGWSDTIGWISMNCSNDSSCGVNNYGVTIDASGNLSGYAWSENIGWIKFGGLSSFPSGSGTSAANAQVTGTNLTGWARACAGTAGGDCSSMTSRSDGWDGWIALSGAGYGPTLSGSNFSGYAWGDVNLGWIDFSGVSTTYQACSSTQGYYCSGNTSMHRDAQCTVTSNQVCSYSCASDTGLCVPPPPPSGTLSGGAALKVTPTLVHAGGTVSVQWGVQNATSCTVAGSNNDGTGSNSTGTWSGLSGTKTSSALTISTTFTLSCVGLSGGASAPVASVTVSPVPVFQEI